MNAATAAPTEPVAPLSPSQESRRGTAAGSPVTPDATRSIATARKSGARTSVRLTTSSESSPKA